MIEQVLTIGLVIERRTESGPWGGYAWRPVTVFPVPPDVSPWTPLGSSGKAARYYAGEVDIHLYSTDTANYLGNLAAAPPRLWVVLRPSGPEPPVEIVAVTADPAEGEAHTEAGQNVVETLEMPPEIAAAVAAFASAHHVERPMHKRQRDKARPDRRDGPD